MLRELARLPQVDLIAEYVRPRLYADHARHLIGADAAQTAAAGGIDLTGDGEIVGIADTGIDDAHPDFAGRIVTIIARGRAGDHSDPAGHGTHVAGCVLGDGTASGGVVKGTAPKAKLFFQSLLDASGHLGGLPLDLNDLFLEAYNAGVRIHNDSWGSDGPSRYTINSEEVDEFVQAHPDMLIVLAAGNEGRAPAAPLKSAVGFVDWLSIGTPASSKNAITIGASRSDRIDGPSVARTWGAAWPADFTTKPIAAEFISGDPESLAAFSSRGPCDDRRIKPDVVAPGTDIAAAKSSLAPLRNFWGSYPTGAAAPNPHYAYDGGTSMAAPLVTGAAAAIRQYYVAQGHQPSAALLKATLVNSTGRLGGADSTAPTTGFPNYHQGHGRIDLSRAVPNAARPAMQLFFSDDWNTAASGLGNTGDYARFQLNVAAGCPELRVCLAYTDLPARALQNNVNLIVQRGGDPKKYVGNADLPNALTILDVDNNLESVRITKPAAGVYYILVVASNLLKGPQTFALVITGEGLSAFTVSP